MFCRRSNSSRKWLKVQVISKEPDLDPTISDALRRSTFSLKWYIFIIIIIIIIIIINTIIIIIFIIIIIINQHRSSYNQRWIIYFLLWSYPPIYVGVSSHCTSRFWLFPFLVILPLSRYSSSNWYYKRNQSLFTGRLPITVAPLTC